MSLSACTLDFIPPSLIQSCSNIFIPILTNLANLSLSTGVFPRSFKISQISPLLKKPGLPTTDLSNFRPIANLNAISKLLERIVLSRITAHLASVNTLNPFQSAYKKRHSTESALLCILNDLHQEMNNSRVSLLDTLDMSAAFDTIDHGMLLTRLRERFGIDDLSLDWFRSYLADRSQFVYMSGESSSVSPCNQGVPQGSVLGPLLFSLYITPLADIIASSDLRFHQYADDTQLYVSFDAEKHAESLKKLENCTVSIKNWLSYNYLQLNPSKSEAMLIGTPKQLAKLSPITSVNIAGSSIALCSKLKNLGAHLDSGLTLNDHVTQQSNSCYYHIRQLKHIRPFLTDNSAKTVSQAIVFSRLDYCNAILTNTSQSNITKLQRVQNCLARVVTKQRRVCSITDTRKTLHWLPVASRIQYKTALLTYKTLSSGQPVYLASLLNRYLPPRPLRSSTQHLLVEPRIHLTSTRRSFSFSAPNIWNSLPESIKLSSSEEHFKRSLKTHLFTLAYP